MRIDSTASSPSHLTHPPVAGAKSPDEGLELKRIWVAVAVWVSVGGSPAGAALEDGTNVDRRPLRVEVTEHTSEVVLRIRMPMDADPGSVEVLLSGSDVTIRARELGAGRRRYQQRVSLSGPVSEHDVTAETEGLEWLRIVLPRSAGGHEVAHRPHSQRHAPGLLAPE